MALGGEDSLGKNYVVKWSGSIPYFQFGLSLYYVCATDQECDCLVSQCVALPLQVKVLICFINALVANKFTMTPLPNSDTGMSLCVKRSVRAPDLVGLRVEFVQLLGQDLGAESALLRHFGTLGP